MILDTAVGLNLMHGPPSRCDVPGYEGKCGAVPRNVWVYFLFWGCVRLLSPLQKKATKRVCMVESPSYRIWGAPDFWLPPSTLPVGGN